MQNLQTSESKVIIYSLCKKRKCVVHTNHPSIVIVTFYMQQGRNDKVTEKGIKPFDVVRRISVLVH